MAALFVARFWQWRWRLGALALACAAGAYFLYVETAGPKVELAMVTRRDIVQTVVASGRVASPNRIDVGSQVAGAVAAVPVEQGQSVKAGQRLIVLESSEARALVQQGEATLANAQAQLERAQRLYASGFYGKSALDDAQRNFEVARTQLDASRARLAYAFIQAPADGVLIARDVERGEMVQPGKVLMVLAPAGETQLVLQIDERNLSRLRLGQQALASADAYPAERFAAEVVYINPGVDAQRGTVEVKLRVPRPPDYLRQDMTVSVDVQIERRTAALTLAADAVRDASGPAPWVLRVSGGRAERQAVSLGLRGDALVQVLQGLAEGDRVVPAANARVKAGQRVRAAGA